MDPTVVLQREFKAVPLRLSRAAMAGCVAVALVSCAAPASRSGSPGAADAFAPLRQEDALWLERVSFGLESTTVADYRRLGRERYLEEQLHDPGEELPPPIAAQIQEISHQTAPQQRLRELQERRKAINAMADGPEKDQARSCVNRWCGSG